MPGPLTIIGRGESDEGPLIGFLTLTTIDGPNDVEIIVGKPGGVRGRVSMEGGVPLGAVGARLALVREGFTPLGASEAVRRRGLRVANDRLVIRNAEILDVLEIVIGPR